MRTVVFISILFFIHSLAFGQQKLNRKLFDYAGSATKNEDFDDLVEYLKWGAKSKKELAEVIAYWIMQNIDYDAKGFMNNTYTPSTWASTFATRKAICSGYAALFKEFCDRVNIQCEIISGYAKGYGYSLGDNFTRSNHTWNTIQLNGDFYLMDLTWASGFVELVGDSLEFFRFYKPELLFANPQKFAEEHLPCQRRWQLLNYPISFEKFSHFESFEQMNDSLSGFYNYQDSIQLYLKLNLVNQRIKDAQESYSINPSKLELANSYEFIAYQLAQNITTKQQLIKSKEFYLLAKELYNKSVDISRCQKGVEYVEYYLKKM